MGISVGGNVPNLGKPVPAYQEVADFSSVTGPRVSIPTAKEFSDRCENGDRYVEYEALRRLGSIVEMPNAGRAQSTFNVVSYIDAQALLTSKNVGVNTSSHRERSWEGPLQNFPRTLFDVSTSYVLHRDGDTHAQIRNFFAEPFKNKQVQASRESVEKRCAALFDQALEDSTLHNGKREFCLIEKIARPLPLSVIYDALDFWCLDGVLTPDDVSTVAFATASTSTSGENYNAAKAILKEKVHQVYEALQGSDSGRQLIDCWNQMQPSLGHEVLVSNVIFLILAGHETTTSLIANMTHALIHNPAEWQRIKNGEVTTRAVVDEALRYDSPVQNTARYAVNDFEYGGVQFAANDLITIWLGAANRDPNKYPLPDHFLVNRGQGFGLAFGAGSHTCPGAFLSILEGEIFLKQLVDRFDKIELAPSAEPARLQSPTFRGFSRLPLMVS